MTKPPLTLEQAPSEIRRYVQHGHKIPKADRHGHRTRYSDSSIYDEVCLLCGETDERPEALRSPCRRPISDEEIERLTKPPKAEVDWDPQA